MYDQILQSMIITTGYFVGGLLRGVMQLSAFVVLTFEKNDGKFQQSTDFIHILTNNKNKTKNYYLRFHQIYLKFRLSANKPSPLRVAPQIQPQVRTNKI